MHEVQETMKKAKDLDDDSLVEVVISGWEIVCKENAEQRHLVTRSQFEQWVAFRDETGLRIHEILDFSDGPLSVDDRAYLENIAKMISSARHKTETELIAEMKANEERERLALEAEAQDAVNAVLAQTPEKKKAGWLNRLKDLFAKS